MNIVEIFSADGATLLGQYPDTVVVETGAGWCIFESSLKRKDRVFAHKEDGSPGPNWIARFRGNIIVKETNQPEVADEHS